MATIVWPVTLPVNPLTQGWSEGPGDSLLENSLPRGPDQVKRIKTDAPKPVSAVYRMTAAQVSTFKNFYETTSKHGALRFDWTHPSEGTVEARFKKGDGYKIAARGPTLSMVQVNLLWLV